MLGRSIEEQKNSYANGDQQHAHWQREIKRPGLSCL
jgi:hypothetical protein